jgi:hypothetical protein
MSVIKYSICFILLAGSIEVHSQKLFSIKGALGFTYEGYGLSVKPGGWTGYPPRKPYNQLRFNFSPVLKFGKDFTLPFNFNFAAKPTSIAGPYAGLRKPSFKQWLTNPGNNFSINPKFTLPQYKFGAELQLGTQYLRYSELSTGDVGIFGAGLNLDYKGYTFKVFAGSSQQSINYVPASLGIPLIPGSYKRNHWMIQLGKEKEKNYKVQLNIARGEDRYGILASPPPTILPQEGAVVSIVLEKYFKKGWFIQTEGAQSAFTKDLYQSPSSSLYTSFKPLIHGRASTQKDNAVKAAFGKKTDNFELGYSTRYIGAGFQVTGYPYMSPDRWENTINTRFLAWKKKINIVASIGQRVNNLSSTTTKAKQFIGNLNWFTQFNDKFNVNLTYNNFGFTSASGFNPFGIRNISNDAGVSSNYTWSNAKRMNLLSFSYNFSKYDERDVITGVTSSNLTHTVLMTYIPTYLKNNLAPEFSIMYFNNNMNGSPSIKNTLINFSTGLSAPAMKNKMQLRGQLQYTIGKLNSFSSNNNLIASLNIDHKLSKKLTWNIFLSSNYFKYGNEIVPDGANYLETNYRTGMQYKF